MHLDVMQEEFEVWLKSDNGKECLKAVDAGDVRLAIHIAWDCGFWFGEDWGARNAMQD